MKENKKEYKVNYIFDEKSEINVNEVIKQSFLSYLKTDKIIKKVLQ